MGKHVLYKKSNVFDKKPKPEDLEYGEIAINYKKNKENIYIKNDENEIIKFVSESDLAHATYELFDIRGITSLNGGLTPCDTTEIPTDITNGLVSLRLDDEKAKDWIIVNLAKWELFDKGTRVPAFPIFVYNTENGRTLNIGFKTTGTEPKSFNQIGGAMLLKHKTD